jgi:hypothetical protein
VAPSPTPRVAMLFGLGSRRSLCRSPRFRTPVTTGDYGLFLPVFKTGRAGQPPGLEGSIPSPRRAVAVAGEPAVGLADVRCCHGERGLTELSFANARGQVPARFREDAVALEMPVPAAERDFLPRSLWAVGAPPPTAGSRLK